MLENRRLFTPINERTDNNDVRQFRRLRRFFTKSFYIFFLVRRFRRLRRFFVKTFYIFTFLNETVCTVFGILYARFHQNNGKAVDLIFICNFKIVGQHRRLLITNSISND